MNNAQLHFWHSEKQAEHSKQFDGGLKFFQGKLYTNCTDSEEEPAYLDDFHLVGVGGLADVTIS